MDLLGQEQKKEQPKGKKLILILLIVSVVLLILTIAMIYVLQANRTRPLNLSVNGANVQISENMIISDEAGINYISLQQLSSLIGYEYLRGGYLEYIEDNTKCYLENANQVIGFETNSNKIYKTTPNTNIDYQYYDLKNKIIQYNGVLYISLDDLNVGCNVVYSFSEQNYMITIDTPSYLTESYKKSFTEQDLYSNVSEEYKNQKAISYNMIVVVNNNEKVGVIDSNLNTVIGNKYSSMIFDEYTQSFIVSSDNKYGVISKQGKVIIELKYEWIGIINYSPLLYAVKQNNKFGVLDETGKPTVNIEYDKLGFTQSSDNQLLIINNLNNNQTGIVVYKNGKYGIANLLNGKIILDCTVDKIYSKLNNSGEENYCIEIQGKEIELNSYIDYVNTTTVNLNT